MTQVEILYHCAKHALLYAYNDSKCFECTFHRINMQVIPGNLELKANGNEKYQEIYLPAHGP
jgi:hypothetical protein